ncbi:Hypothetical predicted protein [Mytilus galloprovincialis]|uniref:C2H2-type domain-containing protein n=1 Tax=Mytilus galloprovincialis TaxID=29158 RepID=A0A8B6F242_MYTGA|nr:Hypothetical predicted protein [Mytilus galloprovincialis]
MDESFEIEGIDESLVTIEVETENQNEFKCNVCQFSSNYKRNLTRRMDSKHAAPAHEVTTKTQLCSICGKMYKTPYGLSLHVKTIHEKVFRYQCYVCQRGFATLWNYKGHVASHDTALKERCSICNATYQYKKSLLQHHNTCHRSKEEKTTYECSVCQLVVSSKSSPTEHTKAIHNGRFVACTKCGKQFKWRSSLAYHNKHVQLR